MSGENKFLIGIGIITVILVVGGVFFFSKGGSSTPPPEQNFDKAQLIQGAKHTRGAEGSPVTIVEFADIQCPACRAAQPIVNQTLEKHSQNVYFIFRHYPLPIHKNSKVAAKAAEAAGNQGKFFEMIDLMYSNQSEWDQDGNPREDYQKYASGLSLNIDQFKRDMEEDSAYIMEDYALGNRAGVESTPTYFINGQKYPGVIQADQFDKIIDGIVQNQEQNKQTP